MKRLLYLLGYQYPRIVQLTGVDEMGGKKISVDMKKKKGNLKIAIYLLKFSIFAERQMEPGRVSQRFPNIFFFIRASLL